MKRLEPLEPRFVSCTYGAGGTTRTATWDTVMRMRRETRLTAAAHMTCVGATREDIEALAADYWAEGVRHIAGAPRRSAGRHRRLSGPTSGGVRNAAELVACLKRVADSEISVAAYRRDTLPG